MGNIRSTAVNGLYVSVEVWPDGYIIFQYFAIYSNENFPNGRPNLSK